MIIGIYARGEAKFPRQQSDAMRGLEFEATAPVRGWGYYAVPIVLLATVAAAFTITMAWW